MSYNKNQTLQDINAELPINNDINDIDALILNTDIDIEIYSAILNSCEYCNKDNCKLCNSSCIKDENKTCYDIELDCKNCKSLK